MLPIEEITAYFSAVARRAPTEAELDQLSEHTDADSCIAEILEMAGADAIRVARFFQVFYDRLPDGPGLDFWTAAAPLMSDTALAEAFFAAGEFEAIYGSLSTEDAVRALYENVLGRAADPDGFAFWHGLVEDPTNGFGLDDLGREFALAPETLESFEPMTEAYLAGLARGEVPRGRLFDYADDAVKPFDTTRFDGGEQKVSIPEPVDLAALTGATADVEISDIGTFNVDSARLMNLDALRADPRFAGIDGSGLTVAVIDTGIDLDHPAFGPVRGGVSERIVAAVDFTNERDRTADDIEGHGSHVASIIASENPNYLGVAPGANIAALQALDYTGSGFSFWIENALRWVVDNAAAENIVAVNMSLGTVSNISTAQPNPSGYADELAQLEAMGVAVIASAGNSYEEFQSEGVSDLAADPNAIAVGALWDERIPVGSINGLPGFGAEVGDIAYFSQRASHSSIDTVFAPGALILGAAPGGGSTQSAGTSQAAPQVAGLVALAQDIALENLGRRLSVDEVEFVLHEGAVAFVDSEIARDTVFNSLATYDMVDALGMAEAILALDGGVPTPPPGTGPAPTPPPGADVPGDAGTGAAIALGTSLDNALETPFDTDWFAVDLVAGGTYRFTLQGAPSGTGTLTDPLISLVDETGRVLATDDDGGLGLEADLSYTAAETGRVYVEARAYSDQTGTYRLGAEVISGGDDFPASPATPSVLVEGAPVVGTIESKGDHDWHRLDLVAGRTYDILLAGVDGAGGSLADPVLAVYDADGGLIAENDDAEGRDAAVVIEAFESGPVYVDAGAFGDADTGSYTLSVASSGGGGGGGGAPGGDIPGDISTDVVLPDGTAIASDLETIGDSDWFAVDLIAGEQYEIAVVGSSTSAAYDLLDPVVGLFDSRGNLIAWDDDGGQGRDPLLIAEVAQSGPYFVGVGAWGGFFRGSYEVSLTGLGGGTPPGGPGNPGGPGVPGGDIPEGPGTWAAIAPGDIVYDSLEETGDRDWFALELQGGASYSVALGGFSSGAGTLLDPYLRLYDASGFELLADDDSYGFLDAQMDFVAPRSGLYYVEAAAFDDLYAGTYGLAVSGPGGFDIGVDTFDLA
ncbi:MAG: S8 family serine peptidase [Pikeienuella sp.]